MYMYVRVRVYLRVLETIAPAIFTAAIAIYIYIYIYIYYAYRYSNSYTLDLNPELPVFGLFNMFPIKCFDHPPVIRYVWRA